MDRVFQYIADIQEIPRIREDLGFLKKEWVVSDGEIRQIQVIIEELFSNIVRHAFKDNRDHMVDIRLAYMDANIEIEIIDDGIPFNPLDFKNGIQKDPAKIEESGMGLPLVKAFSSGVSYRYDSGRNHLTITKKLKNL
jgi:anti-sigma regulatory factor (Ser/Thr protein kinase)